MKNLTGSLCCHRSFSTTARMGIPVPHPVLRADTTSTEGDRLTSDNRKTCYRRLLYGGTGLKRCLCGRSGQNLCCAKI